MGPHRDRVQPVIGGLNRREWVVRAHRALLPSAVKNLIWGMGGTTGSHWHDDHANLHAITHEKLAGRIGKSERTVRRLIVAAVDAGWLVKHRRGHNGRQGVYHFVSPSDPVRCPDPTCARLSDSEEEEDGVEMGQALAVE